MRLCGAVIICVIIVTCYLVPDVAGKSGSGRTPSRGGKTPSKGSPSKTKSTKIGTKSSYPPSKGLSGNKPAQTISDGGKGAGSLKAGAAGAAGGAVGGVAGTTFNGQNNKISGPQGQPSYPVSNGLSGGSPGRGPPPPYSPSATNYGFNQPSGGQTFGSPNYGSAYSGGRLSYVSPSTFGKGGSSGVFGPTRNTGFVSNTKLGNILTGLTYYNVMNNGAHHRTRGKQRKTDPEKEAVLKQLSNCTLTVTSYNETEVLIIPCDIVTSFAPEAVNDNDTLLNTTEIASDADSSLNCTITLYTITGLQTETTLNCDTLSNITVENETLSAETNDSFESSFFTEDRNSSESDYLDMEDDETIIPIVEPILLDIEPSLTLDNKNSSIEMEDCESENVSNEITNTTTD